MSLPPDDRRLQALDHLLNILRRLLNYVRMSSSVGTAQLLRASTRLSTRRVALLSDAQLQTPSSSARRIQPVIAKGGFTPLIKAHSRPTAVQSNSNNLQQRPVGRRTLFIQTESTPNADALKFKPNHRVLPENLSTSFLEYLSPRATISPPHPSPLAGQLLAVDGVAAVFYGADYITITKDSAANWGHVKPEVFSLITEAVSNGAPIVAAAEGAQSSEQGHEQETLEASEEDSEVVSMIKELLETRIRPAIQEDGGDIEFRGFTDGWVKLKLRGACRTCDSSTVTLRNGIESMLMHYVEEVKGVEQVMDEEEQVAMREFAKFEEKLKQTKGPDAVASSGGKGTLDTAEA